MQRHPGIAPGKSATRARSPGKVTIVQARYGNQRAVQPKAMVAGEPKADRGSLIHEAAERGTKGSGGMLPFIDEIQRSFGDHDVSGVRAHTDAAAASAASDMGAAAFATGDHVAFGRAPDLHTAAHEAAHVIQQRAGVHLMGGVGNDGDRYEQHADAVADRVVAGESAEALLDAHAGAGPALPAVQPKVYIKNKWLNVGGSGGSYREKTKTGRGGGSEALINDMVKSYYFDSKDEMEAYANGTSTTAGFVGNTWVNLPTKMTVLGEYHSDRTLLDIVAGTHTTKYAYEGFTGAPTDQTNLELATALSARSDELTDAKAAMPATADNQGEAFLPKMIRMLAEISVTEDTITSSEHGNRAIKLCILYAKQDSGAVGAAYAANTELLDRIANADGNMRVLDLTRDERTVIGGFITTFVGHARQAAAADFAAMSANDQAKYTTHRDPAGSPRYVIAGDTAQNRLKDEGDDARDVSMYKHIKEATAAGHVLYGLGDSHRQRLAPLLEAENIPHMTVDRFLDLQDQEHPQQ